MKYQIYFNGNGRKADSNGPTDKAATYAEARAIIEQRVMENQGHPDFVGGYFEILEATPSGDLLRCEPLNETRRLVLP